MYIYIYIYVTIQSLYSHIHISIQREVNLLQGQSAYLQQPVSPLATLLATPVSTAVRQLVASLTQHNMLHHIQHILLMDILFIQHLSQFPVWGLKRCKGLSLLIFSLCHRTIIKKHRKRKFKMTSTTSDRSQFSFDVEKRRMRGRMISEILPA